MAAGCSRVEDVNREGRGDIVDTMAVASRWRTAMDDADYHFTFDIDRDWDIDTVDVMLAAAAWGARCGE